MKSSRSEGKQLSSNATTLLYMEFIRRGLDASIFTSLRAERFSEHQKHFEDVQAKEDREFSVKVWNHCFDAKLKQQPDIEIQLNLVAQGVSSEQSFWIVSQIDDRAKELKNVYEADIMKGALAIIGGIAIFLFATKEFHLSFYLFAFALIVTGAARLVNTIPDYEKISRILKAIQAENQRAENL